jgi:hypothetical protein
VTDETSIQKAALRVGLTDDNPAENDLLGFDAIVLPIKEALRQSNLDPITIGVHAPWGGGKSTVLNLLTRELKGGTTICIRTSPWEYDDQFDVKGTLIAEVLARLQQERAADEALKERVKKLLKRVSWSRVGIAVARGVLTMQWDPDKLIDAFSLQAEDESRSMAEFRDEFAELLAALDGVDRVVVLVDDLDRCLPPAVLATLEAIKLFLSVKGMAFVIAADQHMIRDAIAANLAATNRSEGFADRYLEKIVQLPVALPRLSQPETEAYIALLLAANSSDHAKLVAQVRTRRRDHQVPLVVPDGIGDPRINDILTLSAQIAEGLSTSQRGNPREIKRFLNAFGVRSAVAEARGVSLAPPVMVKLLFLEEQHRPEFERLAGLGPTERREFLSAWEAWAREGKPRPAGEPTVRAETKPWAASVPRLGNEDINDYITLAASLAAASVRGGLSDEQRELVRELVGDSDANRDVALDRVAGKPLEEQLAIVGAILSESRRATAVTHIVEALVGLGKRQQALAADIAVGIRTNMWSKLEEAIPVLFADSGVEAFVDLARRMTDDETLGAGVREAARDALKPDG